METGKISKSIQVIYWVARLGYYLVILGGIVMIGLIIPLLAGWEIENTNFTMELPAVIKTDHEGVINIGSNPIQVELRSLQGEIRFENFYTSDFKFRMLFSLFLVVFYGGFIFIAYFFMRFIRNIHQRLFFSYKNEQYLKLISYLVVGMWILLKALFIVVYFYFTRFLNIEGVELGAPNINGFNQLLFGVFVYVLAKVFAEGRRIDEENRLTV